MTVPRENMNCPHDLPQFDVFCRWWGRIMSLSWSGHNLNSSVLSTDQYARKKVLTCLEIQHDARARRSCMPLHSRDRVSSRGIFSFATSDQNRADAVHARGRDSHHKIFFSRASSSIDISPLLVPFSELIGAFFCPVSQNRWEKRGGILECLPTTVGVREMKPEEALRELSEPWTPGDRVKAAIQRAARASGLPYWRAFDIWYRKARRIDHSEIVAIADAIEKKRDREARNELQELRTRLAKLESRLSQTDPEFYRPQIDFLGRIACRSG